MTPIVERTRSLTARGADTGRAGASPLLLLCVAQFVLQLDFSIVNIALRTIAGELHFSAVSLQWVVTGYALSFGSLLLLGGRLETSSAGAGCCSAVCGCSVPRRWPAGSRRRQ